jgi:hypothetical protein
MFGLLRCLGNMGVANARSWDLDAPQEAALVMRIARRCHMKHGVIVLGLLAALPSGESLAKVNVPETNNPFVPLVAKSYDSLEFDTAISTLQKASNWPNNTSRDLLWLELMDGVLQVGAGNEASALAAFKRALLLEPNAQLPIKGSAKLRTLFGQARSDLGLPPTSETTRPAVSPAQPPRQSPTGAQPPARPPVEVPSAASETKVAQTTQVSSVALTAPVETSSVRPPPTMLSRGDFRSFLGPILSPHPIAFLVGLRGESDILGRGITSAVTAEVSRGPLAGALTVLVQRAPGVRVEGRYYFLDQRIRPYAAIGTTTFFPDTAGRLGAGVVLALGSVRLSADAAYERIFNPSVSYAPNVLLFSLGVGWRFSLTGT